MPRAPSIHLQLSRVCKLMLSRIERKYEDPRVEVTKEDGQTVVYLAQADKYMRGRMPTDEELKDAENEAVMELSAKEISQRLRDEAMKPIPVSDDREDVDS